MPVNLTNLYGGYARAGRYNPVDKRVLQRGLKPYKIEFAQLKGQSDSALRRLAAKAVIEKYRARKNK